MLGFGPKLNTVFASRWKAVMWSMGVLLTAYCTVPAADQTPKHEAKVADREAALAKAHDRSPWAIEK